MGLTVSFPPEGFLHASYCLGEEDLLRRHRGQGGEFEELSRIGRQVVGGSPKPR